jgi:hypothetical protein
MDLSSVNVSCLMSRMLLQPVRPRRLINAPVLMTLNSKQMNFLFRLRPLKLQNRCT